MNSTITDAELAANSLLRLGTAPAYTCGKCGESVGRGEGHDCPAMAAARAGALKVEPVLGAPERMADAPPIAVPTEALVSNLSGEVAELARRLAVLEQQLAATPLPESDGEPTVLVEKQGRRKH